MEPSRQKRLEKKNFQKKRLQNVYDMRGKNYICKAFLYGYMVVTKFVQYRIITGVAGLCPKNWLCLKKFYL